MTRIIARAGDGTETDVTDDLQAFVSFSILYEWPETPLRYVIDYLNDDELEVRARLWPLIGRHNKFREYIDEQNAGHEEEAKKLAQEMLRAQFEADTQAEREAQFQAWAAAKEQP